MHQPGGWGPPSLSTLTRETEVDVSAKGRGPQGRPSSQPRVCVQNQSARPRRLLSPGTGLVGQRCPDSRRYMPPAYRYYLHVGYSVHGALLGDPHRFERSRNRNRQPHEGIQGSRAMGVGRLAGAGREQGSVVILAGSRGARLSLSASPSPHFGPQSNLVSRFPTLNWS